VTLGTSSGPEVVVNHAEANGVYEALYLRPALSAVGQPGHIVQLGFDKASGSDLTPLTNVVIYLRNTAATSLGTGPLDTTGYQRVFRGVLANSTAGGVQLVRLDRSFYYDYAGSLGVLILRRGGNVNATSGQRALFRGGAGGGQAFARAGSGGAAFPSASTVLTPSTTVANFAVFYGPATALRPGRLLFAAPTPVPATESLQLTLPNDAGPTLSVQLTDALGQLVGPRYELAAQGRPWELPLGGVAPGLYWLQVRRGAEQASWRVVKQ
jgi:hypothetical protein